MGKYKVVVIDMDGTLLDSNKQISIKNKEAIIKIQKRGIKVTLASGRPLNILMEDALKIELDKYGGYLVGNNGQEFYDFKERKIYRGDKLPKDTLIKTLKFAKDNDLKCLGLTQDYRFMSDDVKGEYEQILKDCKDMIFDKICIKDFPFIEDIDDVAKKLRTILQDECQALISDGSTIELVPFGVDKVVGVNRVKDLNNLDNEEILVIGDGENDYQMACHYPFVAMKDAFFKLKEKAIFITDSNDRDGVAKAIEKFIS